MINGQSHDQRHEELKTMMWWNDGLGWGGWIMMALTMGIFWSLVVFAIVAIFRMDGNARSSDQRPAERSPLQILDERFARGEIDADEYHARQEVLRDRH